MCYGELPLMGVVAHVSTYAHVYTRVVCVTIIIRFALRMILCVATAITNHVRRMLQGFRCLL